jgi:ketosteroid isomerase-like protein
LARMRLMWRPLVVLLMLLAAAHLVMSQEMSLEQKAVWQMKEAYWRYKQTGNLTNYMNLWRDDFLGWPRMTDAPVGKDGIAGVFQDQTATRHDLSYEFPQKAVQVSDGIGVTLYSVKLTFKNNNGQTETRISRITHTWIKRGGTWKILGGSYAEEN